MGIIAFVIFLLYSVFGFAILSIGYLLFHWKLRPHARPLVAALVLTVLHFSGYFLYLLQSGESLKYDGTSLVVPFLLVSLIIGLAPVYICFYGVCKTVTRFSDKRPQ